MLHPFINKFVVQILSFIVLTVGCIGCASTFPKINAKDFPTHVKNFGLEPTKEMILVDSKKQTLTLLKDNKVHKTYTISTGKKGLGEHINTFKTPQGLHRINEKIGEGVPKYGIFHRRKYVGTWKKQPKKEHRKDYISTRILRLEGLQPGQNKGKDWLGRMVDTEARGVYIHGTTMEWQLGAPHTKGCVHMSADDVISLFNQVPEGTLVWIN